MGCLKKYLRLCGKKTFKTASCFLKGLFQKHKKLNRKVRNGFSKVRKVLNFKNIFFATFAKNLCVFAVKKLLG